MRRLHLSLAALVGSALLAAPAFAQGESRLDPQPQPPATAPPPVPLPPFTPPTGKAALIEAPLPDPPAKRGPLYRGWTYPEPMGIFAYPVDMTHPIWVQLDGGVAHDMSGGIPAPAIEYKVILHDGSVLLARDAPRLARGTVRFPDPRGLLVSVRASDVDLPATAAANGLDWHDGAAVPKAPQASTPAAAPKPPPPPPPPPE